MANDDRQSRINGDGRSSSSDFNALFERVYDELHALASAKMRQQPAHHTLTPTALVNEVYIKVKSSDGAPDEHRRLLGLCACAMRHVLVDHARGKGRSRRGGGWRRISFSNLASNAEPDEYDLIAFGRSIEELGRLSERKARVVELRCFADMTNEDVADALSVSRSTVASDWRFARAWLRSRLTEEGVPDDVQDV